MEVNYCYTLYFEQSVIEYENYIRVKTKKGDEYKVVGFKYLNPDEDIAILTIKTTKKFVLYHQKAVISRLVF